MKKTEARTERGDFLFRVSEFGDGTPWISTEPRDGGMPFLDHALLGFDLPKGTSLQKAEQIAEFMNKNLGNVSVTIFGEHLMFPMKPE